MDLGLTDKVVLVTGGSKGIGKACMKKLASEGARGSIVARNEERLERVAGELSEETGREVVGFAGDLTEWENARRVVDETLQHFGQLDILVNCAGSAPGGLLEDLTEEDWMKSLNLKFMGYVRMTRAVVPHMKERGEGVIVNVVGNDGVKPSYWEITAGAANAADLNFTEAIAKQYGKHGVRINSVNPGPVSTDRWRELVESFARDLGVSVDKADEIASDSIPLGRICRPDEVASVVAFMASEQASFINGTSFEIDGAQQKDVMDLARDR